MSLSFRYDIQEKGWAVSASLLLPLFVFLCLMPVTDSLRCLEYNVLKHVNEPLVRVGLHIPACLISIFFSLHMEVVLKPKRN